ncbi:hypothetical protein [Gemmobacter aquaticus]|nr:hypothetical protein [Gemmobacter aquaticus]
MDPHLDQDQIDSTAASYFSHLASFVRAGNPPDAMPLPAETLLEYQPEVLASLYRDQIREALRAQFVQLPVKVAFDQTLRPYYEEKSGLKVQPISLENDLERLNPKDPLAGITLSDRDLGLYQLLPLSQAWSDERDMGLVERIYKEQRQRITFELDRLLKFDPIPMDIQTAAARGDLRQLENVILRWEMTITDVRVNDNDVIVSAALDRLTLRWSSDNAPVAEWNVAALPTVAGFRQQIEAALPPRATADQVMTPPAGTRFGAEMADLLQLRYLPETVDDIQLQRMMHARFGYESSVSEETTPDWGSFFRDFANPPPDERLAEFRSWSEARASALPESLTLVVPLPNNGRASAERAQQMPRQSECAEAAVATGSAMPDEKQMVQDRICAYLGVAWRQPTEYLFFPEAGKAPQGGGLRGNCTGRDLYCSAIYYARIGLKIPDTARSVDIVRLDRFPVLDLGLVADHPGKLWLELTVTPTGAVVQDTWPDTIWHAAQRNAQATGAQYGLQHGFRIEDVGSPGTKVYIFEVSARAARLVEDESGKLVAELPLVTPVAPPVEMLEMPAQTNSHDILGIQLGMSFDEADAILRKHMEVGKVLVADRGKQMGTVGGSLQPYSSGRLYISAAGTELIAIYDEPPAAPDRVLAMWRMLRLPKGDTDAAQLKAALTDRYGEPGKIEEVGLPMMQKGLAFSWMQQGHERCSVIETTIRPDHWLDETGAAWQPPFNIPRFHTPSNELYGYLDVKDQPLPPGSFCPAMLGARYASPDGKSYSEPAGEEVITWLNDNRSYAKFFYESLAAPPAQPSAGASGNSAIKF